MSAGFTLLPLTRSYRNMQRPETVSVRQLLRFRPRRGSCAGVQPTYPGLDQINLLIPSALTQKTGQLQLLVDGQAAIGLTASLIP